MLLPKNDVCVFVYENANTKSGFECSLMPNQNLTYVGKAMSKKELLQILTGKCEQVYIDQFLYDFFYTDVDNDPSLPWTSKPQELQKEQRFFETNMER